MSTCSAADVVICTLLMLNIPLAVNVLIGLSLAPVLGVLALPATLPVGYIACFVVVCL